MEVVITWRIIIYMRYFIVFLLDYTSVKAIQMWLEGTMDLGVIKKKWVRSFHCIIPKIRNDR